MTAPEAIALYRLEKKKAELRGVNLIELTAWAIPEGRAPLIDGETGLPRRDAFVVLRTSRGGDWKGR